MHLSQTCANLVLAIEPRVPVSDPCRSCVRRFPWKAKRNYQKLISSFDLRIIIKPGKAAAGGDPATSHTYTHTHTHTLQPGSDDDGWELWSLMRTCEQDW